MPPNLTTSVIVPSLGRPERLAACLRSLAAQTIAPQEVIVVWQADDIATRDAAMQIRAQMQSDLRAVYSPRANMVEALNAGMRAVTGDIILRIDDDALAPPDWIVRHLSYYDDASVGAVGGPYDNFHPDGTPFPKRSKQPVGKLTWYGKAFGNMFDHDQAWRLRRPQAVDHLIGANLSLRRGVFDGYDTQLRPYWQLNELDICLQVRSHGYRAIFDFANVVSHYPSGEAATPGRDGDLEIKIYNGAYNHAYILSKYSPWYLRPARLFHLLAVGMVSAPGALAFVEAVRRYGQPTREAAILAETWRHHLAGWRDGAGMRGRIVRAQTASRRDLTPTP
jgi:glycosyltransferase involved in cell wall biosynthesis